MSNSIEKNLFKPGRFVMLHPDAMTAQGPHPEAGRVGKIIRLQDDDSKIIIVEFFSSDDKGTYCLLPTSAWQPVPAALVEEYDKGRSRGFRITDKGRQAFDKMGWARNELTAGDL
jgi:hypothetical protein